MDGQIHGARAVTKVSTQGVGALSSPGSGPLMLRANRCGSGPVHRGADDERLGLLPAGSLNPQKARVLLLLALIVGLDRGGLSARLREVVELS